MMKEYGILFTDPMVCAIRQRRKTVTRRVSGAWAKRLPGDRLWVREAWNVGGWRRDGDRCWFEPLPTIRRPAAGEKVIYRAAGSPAEADVPTYRPSIHMPRWASRLLLEIVAIDAEPFVEVDTVARGPEWVEIEGPILPRVTDEEARREGVHDRAAYLGLWREINGDARPDFVWRVEFRVVGGAL